VTSTIVYLLSCDHAGCTATTSEADAEGWTNAIYTHGCPDHGEAITAHKAKVTDQTRSRGSKEKTTYFLTCACGWQPTPHYEAYSARRLKEQHVKHVAEATALTLEDSP
jgi:hypothetical protein